MSRRAIAAIGVALFAVLSALVLQRGWSRTPAPGDASTPVAPDSETRPPGAHWDVVETLREGRAVTHHAADGGGRAWLDEENSSPGPVPVRWPGRWTVVYEAGPLGIAVGGRIIFLVSPFWGWSPPQTFNEIAPGFTQVTTDAAGVELQAEVVAPPMMGIEIGGRALEPGERVRITYGAGPAGAYADHFAERESRLWIAVDGDGDGVHSTLEDSPAVDIKAGPPARLLLTLPTTARPGDTVELTVAVLDAVGNAGISLEGEVVLQDVPAGLDIPKRIPLAPADRGRRSVDFVVPREGVFRLRAVGPAGLSAESNPLVVSRQGERVWWGDLHGHSNFSDGTGLPEDYFRYARDVAALDVVALTDHDHWGTLPLDEHPRMWEEIKAQTKRFHEPGRFVTVLGYEWTSWIHGHRHVLYFADDGQVFSSIDPQFESPRQLWKALRGRDALTFAHHSAGGPIPTNWSIPPDPVLEPITEVVSVHGVSEAFDSPGRIYDPVEGNFVRDVLDRGDRLGFIGSGDSHDGHPGLSQLGGSRTGGLAAIVAEELTREAVLEALRKRRVYATSGPRILLRVRLDGHPMGSILGAAGSGGAASGGVDGSLTGKESQLRVRAVGTAQIERIEVIRSGEVVESADFEGADVSFEKTITGLRPGEYLYVRAIQDDGGLAWSSPIFIE